ncbi:patatin-like phospholipase domain protein [Rhynchospora pubera]|uniref:Patatin-like phospholipase domain protein n=1 Tax=Rhynchospora pubera TaxID=906938 RepID=A0AAV8CA89_9POAL|nr:patatin-like phospholipase domain protein [Rhynchospora pubera]KAJ4751794.1 patatin-like phospholipase domain protein [Rhynchospora pubera]
MKPTQRSEIARNWHMRREEMARRTASSRSMMEYDKWVEGIKSSDGKAGRSPGAWSSRILPNSKSAQFDRDEEFHWLDKRDDPDVDRTASPILWKKSPAHENTHSATKSQEVEVYRKQMMEMVRGLPEGDYELTLQDIVEKRKEFKDVEPVNKTTVKELMVTGEKETKKKKNQKKYVSVARSSSLDTGLLNRMFLTLSVTARRKSFNLRDHGEKISMKEGEGKKEAIVSKKTKDEEWWRKNEFSEKGSSNASSVGSSTSNGSNSSGDDHFTRNMSMRKTKCYCFRPGKSKARSR